MLERSAGVAAQASIALDSVLQQMWLLSTAPCTGQQDHLGASGTDLRRGAPSSRLQLCQSARQSPEGAGARAQRAGELRVVAPALATAV